MLTFFPVPLVMTWMNEWQNNAWMYQTVSVEWNGCKSCAQRARDEKNPIIENVTEKFEKVRETGKMQKIDVTFFLKMLVPSQQARMRIEIVIWRRRNRSLLGRGRHSSHVSSFLRRKHRLCPHSSYFSELVVKVVKCEPKVAQWLTECPDPVRLNWPPLSPSLPVQQCPGP